MISAVILTSNSVRYIGRCLWSLVADANRTGIELEVFVVDNGSSDGTMKIIDRFAKETQKFKVVRLFKNLGTTVSRNIAIRESCGKYLLILDSDTEILPGALNEMYKTLESTRRAGIVAPRLLYQNRKVQPSCKRFPTALIKFCKLAPISWIQRFGERQELYPPEIYSRDFKEIFRVDHCISACWLVRREAVQDVGLLDEKIFYAPEDVDYCLRMWLSGWEVLYVPNAEVVHYAQRLSRKNLPMAWLHTKGLFYYFHKHCYFLSKKNLYCHIKKTARRHEIALPYGLE